MVAPKNAAARKGSTAQSGVSSRQLTLPARDVSLVAESDFMHGLEPAGKELLLQAAHVRTLSRHEVLFIQGDPARHVFVVLDGWIKLFRLAEDGTEAVIAVFGSGESFAEAAMFGQSVYPVSAEAVEDSRVLAFPDHAIRNAIVKDPENAMAMLGAMSLRLRTLVRQIEQLSRRLSAQRLAAFLVRLCPQESGSATVRLPVEKSLVAGRLGMQPETFSRSLSKLKQVGIRCRGPEVTVADIAKLKDFSQHRS